MYVVQPKWLKKNDVANNQKKKKKSFMLPRMSHVLAMKIKDVQKLHNLSNEKIP